MISTAGGLKFSNVYKMLTPVYKNSDDDNKMLTGLAHLRLSAVLVELNLNLNLFYLL